MTHYNNIKASCEAILSTTAGTDIEIQVRLKNFDKEAFRADCERIRQNTNYQCGELELTDPKKDPYYLALKICLDKYPYVNDKNFADAFGVKRTAIVMARKKIEEILQSDNNFKTALETITD